jgi:preprotein translocase subunit SecE
MADTAKKTKTSWFKGLKGEYKKVVWPNRKTITRQTGDVLFVSIIMGLIIAIVDFVTRIGIEFLVK